MILASLARRRSASDLPTSEIDILCHATDLLAFTETIWTAFGNRDRFSLRQWTGAERPVIAGFVIEGWEVEIFEQERPVAEQTG